MIFAGPLWIGDLFDKKLARKLATKDYGKTITDKEDAKFFKLLLEEASIGFNTVGFYDAQEILRKSKNIEKLNKIIDELRNKGYKTVRTHFGKQGIKSEADFAVTIEKS